jgi:hypothetical protein
MNLGQLFVLLFDAHVEDWSSDHKKTRCTRYTHEKLEAVLKVIPWNSKKGLYSEFQVLSDVIRRHILEQCKHEKVSITYKGAEECLQCKAYRRIVREDPDMWSYNENMAWSKWDI